MFKTVYIKHDEITLDLINEIIKVKMTAWPYSYESQIAWINSNLKDSDIHMLLLNDKKVVAYLNLINIELVVDSKNIIGYGIGNVCAIERGKGWGKELISQVNTFLVENNKIGLLFCKKELVNFYSCNNWTLVKIDESNAIDKDISIMMIYNSMKRIMKVEYVGNQF